MRGLLVSILVATFLVCICTGHPHKRSYWRIASAFNLETISCDSIKRANLCQCCNDPCDDVECLNKGVCVDGICNCPRGFSGADCGVDNCAAEPCKNNGTCVPKADGVSCKCEDGFTGDYCEDIVDACEPNPCQNCGSCMRIQGGFTCECLGRTSGRTCEVIDNVITSPNYPNDYPDPIRNLTVWTIPGCTGKRIRFVVDQNLALEAVNDDGISCDIISPACNDQLAFGYRRICGNGAITPTTTPAGKAVHVFFLRNGNGIGCTGFNVTYAYID
ncbi:hypothetical protein SNE40_017148 [Patella caerulea]|uniref:Uncharacterized protein n=1 Tax=Patella caerulea TaxID=87958 RepID=A0AAN8PDI2_PATCE